MDAAWKVYVQDRRFDDNQISNLYLKLKYETVGRFSFDFRPIDGDESYMVNGNTLRVFWGDLHKLDGVIQRRDWDEKQFCYHIYGADIRGLLLDRVNTEPATVHSYTSDITTTLMYEGCDFPSNIWTGAGENIGKYTFRYRLGIQNTIRITSATTLWENVIERGTVYEHQNGCLYDATKNWTQNMYRGETLRFVSGACKNNIYNIIGNSTNRVCLGLRSSTCDQYTMSGTLWYRNILDNGGFENSATDMSPWYVSYRGAQYATALVDATISFEGTNSMKMRVEKPYTAGVTHMSIVTATMDTTAGANVEFKYRYSFTTLGGDGYFSIQRIAGANSVQLAQFTGLGAHNPAWPGWDTATVALPQGGAAQIGITVSGDGGGPDITCWFDNVTMGGATSQNPCGFVPGCSRRGDIYEIVTTAMSIVEPPSLVPATLEHDNHVIQYNNVDDQSAHTTSITIRGA